MAQFRHTGYLFRHGKTQCIEQGHRPVALRNGVVWLAWWVFVTIMRYPHGTWMIRMLYAGLEEYYQHIRQLVSAYLKDYFGPGSRALWALGRRVTARASCLVVFQRAGLRRWVNMVLKITQIGI